jgi:energy-coupling factor transporter ATP-binding protein EcfA2
MGGNTARRDAIKQATDLITLIGDAVPSWRKEGPLYVGLCPFHDDKHPSFKVDPRAKTYRCWSCGERGDCFTWLQKKKGLDFVAAMNFLDPAGGGGAATSGRNVNGKQTPKYKYIETYEYTDSEGRYQYEVIRQHLAEPCPGARPKNFPQRRKIAGKIFNALAKGWYKAGGNGEYYLDRDIKDPRPLTKPSDDHMWADEQAVTIFRLPKVLEAIKAGQTIYIPEGEKDVLTLEAQGLVGTCNSGGAGNWLPAFARYFRGADVVIIRDKDDAGYQHAELIYASLRGRARTLRVTEAAEGKDYTDHVNEGYTIDDLRPVSMGMKLLNLADVESRETKWLFKGRVPQGRLVLCAGDPGTGKSTLCRALIGMLTQAAAPREWNLDVVEPSRCLWIAKEEINEEDIKPGLEANHAVIDLVEVWPVEDEHGNPIDEFCIDDKGLMRLEGLIYDYQLKLVVIDTILDFLPSKMSAIDNLAVSQTLAKLVQVLGRTGCTVIALLHLNKNAIGSPLQRVSGAISFYGKCRACLFCGHDPDDKSLMGVQEIKHSKAGLMPAVGYEIDEETGEMRFLGHIELTAERMCEQPEKSKDQKKVGEAKDWLIAQLNFGPNMVEALIERAKEVGISKSTLYDAKRLVSPAKATQPKTEGMGAGKAWWARPGYDWSTHEWPNQPRLPKEPAKEEEEDPNDPFATANCQ